MTFGKLNTKIVHLLIVATFLTFSSSTILYGQYKPNVIVWSRSSSCGAKKLVDETAKVSCSTEEWGSGHLLKVSVKELKVVVHASRRSESLALWTRIENRERTPLQIEPLTWSMASYALESDLKDGKAPLLNETAYQRNIQGQPSGTSTIGTAVIPPSRSNVSGVTTAQRVTTTSSTQTPGAPTPVHRSGQVTAVTGTRDLAKSNQIPQLSRPIPPPFFKGTELVASEIPAKEYESGIVYFHCQPDATFRLAILHVGEYSFVFELR